MIVHPNCTEKFLKLEPTLEALWQRTNRRNATLKVSIDDVEQFQNLMLNFRANKSQIFSKLQGWIGYSAKLEKQRTRPDCDLFTVLPPVLGGSRPSFRLQSQFSQALLDHWKLK
jgi:hypothetical protein